jgi:hypothetical protein
VQKGEPWPSPEEPEESAGSNLILVSALHFEWLTKQCEFLGISKQELVTKVLEEWICRHRTVALPPDPSAMVRRALDEFMQRHRDEFLSVN